jgi:hypothetical protein
MKKVPQYFKNQEKTLYSQLKKQDSYKNMEIHKFKTQKSKIIFDGWKKWKRKSSIKSQLIPRRTKKSSKVKMSKVNSKRLKTS